MIDYVPTLVSSLKEATGLEVYFELFQTSNTPLPAITYNLTNDYEKQVGDTLGYCTLQYYIKLWSNQSYQSIQEQSSQICDCMRDIGFKRVSTNDLVVDDKICRIFLFEAQGQEKFN